MNLCYKSYVIIFLFVFKIFFNGNGNGKRFYNNKNLFIYFNVQKKLFYIKKKLA
jgi:hypothetical protein